MKAPRHALMTGLFVLGAIVLIVAAVLSLGRGDLFNRQLRAVVYFQGSVRGLYVGAPVTFRGVKVGEVDGIDIDVDPASLSTRIPVSLSIVADAIRLGGEHGRPITDLPLLVKRGLRARLVLQSFVTGQTSIDLDFRPNTPLKLVGQGRSKVPEIPGASDRLDALVEQLSTLPLSEVVKQLRQTMASLDLTIRASQKAIEDTSVQLNRTARQAEDTLRIGAGVLQNLETQTQTTLASISKLSDTSRALLQSTQPELVRTLQGTRDAAQSAQEALHNLAELSAPGAPMRADVEASVRELSQAARSLRQFADELERRPNAIVFGK
ncbi:MAG: MlaD family protein [Aquabacterium sp.]